MVRNDTIFPLFEISACWIRKLKKGKKNTLWEKQINILFESEESRISLRMVILLDIVTLQAPATMYSCANEKIAFGAYTPNYDEKMNACVSR